MTNSTLYHLHVHEHICIKYIHTFYACTEYALLSLHMNNSILYTYTHSILDLWRICLQCVAVCCSALQCVAVNEYTCLHTRIAFLTHGQMKNFFAICSTLQCIAVRCSMLQSMNTHIYIHAWHSWHMGNWVCSALQCVAACCSVLHQISTHVHTHAQHSRHVTDLFAVWCSVLQCVAVCVAVCPH